MASKRTSRLCLRFAFVPSSSLARSIVSPLAPKWIAESSEEEGGGGGEREEERKMKIKRA